MNSLFHVNVCDLPDVHGAKLSKITIVFLNSLVLQDLLAKASQKFLESRWRLTKFAIQMLDQAVWRQNIAIEIPSLNRSSSTGRSATPPKNGTTGPLQWSSR